MDSFDEHVLQAIKSSGLPIVILRSETSPHGSQFAEAIGQCQPLTFRFLREHLRDFLELSPFEHSAGPYYSWMDFEIAFGWRTVESAATGGKYRSLDDLLGQIAHRWDLLAEQLRGGPEASGWERVAAARSRRAAAMRAAFQRR